MKIRDAVEADLAAIVAIYNASVPGRLATADLEPVSLESRKLWFEEHPPTHRPLWVLEIEENIAGWLSFQSFNGRPAYQKTAELSLYVSPHYRRRGVGQQLLQQAIAQSPHLELNTLVGLIFAHNHPSLQLFAKHQFQQWGYLPKIAEIDGIKRDLVIFGRPIYAEV
ncbi:MAG: GNAT family N-acetyltransferase [Microcystaceae cyanobacterium]